MTMHPHAESIEILGNVLAHIANEHAHDTLTEGQRAMVVGLGWAIGLLLDPPHEGDAINPDALARRGFEFVMCELILSADE